MTDDDKIVRMLYALTSAEPIPEEVEKWLSEFGTFEWSWPPPPVDK